MSDACYFISDVHLRPRTRPGEAAKQQQLMGFLRHLEGKAERLFIVGDLFDFWFEYGSVMPRRGGRVLGVLADLVDSGTEVVCFGGNHDWWVGRSLVEEYGITVRHEPLWLEAQGLRLYVRHGDGYSQPSRRYDFARFVLHHPVAIGLFRWLHPDVAGRLADYVACRPSRQALNWQPKRHLYPVYERLSAEVFAAGADVAVFGHVHTSRLKATPDGTMVVLGDWKSQASYGELRDGRFRLAMWRDPDQPLWP